MAAQLATYWQRTAPPAPALAAAGRAVERPCLNPEQARLFAGRSTAKAGRMQMHLLQSNLAGQWAGGNVLQGMGLLPLRVEQQLGCAALTEGCFCARWIDSMALPAAAAAPRSVQWIP
jgi:hypothetical protein